MTEEVLEVKIEDADLTVHLPLEDGDDVSANIKERLEEGDHLRWLGDFEVDQVYRMEKY